MHIRLSKVLNNTVKVSLYTVAGSTIISAATIVILFKNLDSLHNKIDKQLFKLTGYHYSYDKLETGFSGRLQPEIMIDNLSIYTKNKNQPLFKIKKIITLLSYKSIWKFEPILSNLTIDGTTIALEYDKLDNLVLNSEVVTNLKTPSQSNFDLEKLLLNQQKIFVSNINLSLYDSKHYPRVIHFSNIFLEFNNQPNEHSLITKLKLGEHTNLEFNANWLGNTLWHLQNWESGNINLKSVNSNGYLIKLNANIKDGALKDFKTRFNSNKQDFAQYDNNIQNFTDFSGAIKVERITSESYAISGRKLTINTKSGYLFKNANLSGYYKESGSQLSLDKLNFDGINSILEIYPATSKITLGGNAYLALNWSNKITTPESITLTANANNLSLKSQESNIPGINNINLSLVAKESSGNINLNLANSVLTYPKGLYHPFKINALVGNLGWEIESNDNTIINWSNLNLKANNFVVNSNGLFKSESAYIDTKLKIDGLNLSKISDDLPRIVSPNIVKRIKSSIIKGTVSNGNISLKGYLSAFPFKSESQGKINISANINNLAYKFSPEWTPIEGINAKLEANNNSLNIKIINGHAGNTSIAKTTLQIKNWLSAPQLIVSAIANGSTTDYIDYLSKSPFADKIEPATKQITIEGKSSLKVGVQLPLSDPKRLRLSGKFITESNHISLIAIPLSIEDINGSINFNQKGVEPSIITAKSLNSDLNLKLDNNQINLNSPNLDYQQLMHLAYKPAESIIYGKAATELSYSLSSQQLNIKSGLSGVTIDAVSPVSKTESETKPLNITLNGVGSTHQLINLNYNNLLYTRGDFNSLFQPNKINIALGSNNYQLQNQMESAKVTAKIDTDRFSFTDWTEFANRLVPKEQNVSLIKTGNESVETVKEARNNAEIYPIQLEINTNGFYAKNYNFDGGTLSANILPESVSAFINTPDIKGNINYQLNENYLDINLQRLLLSSANLIQTPVITNTKKLEESSPNVAKIINESEVSLSGLVKNAESNNESSNTELITNIKPKKINYPNVNLNIDSLYLENHFLGSLKGNMYEESNSLYVENMTIANKAATTKIYASDNCLGCDDEYVGIIVHTDINDFGLLLTKLGQENIFSKGNGSLDATIGWKGGIADFSSEKLQGNATLNIKKGQLIQVNPGLFGSLLGVISISNYATSLNPLGLNSFFGKGFAFDTLDTKLYLNNNQIKIQTFEMVGPIAAVNTFGNLDFANNQIDTFLTLEPRLGGTVATTAGIVTLNPFIGFFVYAAEYLVGEPINKALAMSFHISGNMESPVMTPTKINKQIINNFTSSLNILNIKASD